MNKRDCPNPKCNAEIADTETVCPSCNINIKETDEQIEEFERLSLAAEKRRKKLAPPTPSTPPTPKKKRLFER